MNTKHMGRALPEATEYNAYEAIRAAQLAASKGRDAETASGVRKPALDSADLAARDALACFNRGDFAHARDRALDSLAHSVGVFSPAYQAAADRGPCR